MRDYLLVIFGFATFGLGFLVIQLFKWLGQFRVVKKEDSIKKRAYAKRVVEPPETPSCRCVVQEELKPKKVIKRKLKLNLNGINRKLTKDQAIDIYCSRGDKYSDLADKYGVSTETIKDIKSGKTWSKYTKCDNISPYILLSSMNIVDKEKIVREIYNDPMFELNKNKYISDKYCVAYSTLDYLKTYSPYEILQKYVNHFNLPEIREYFDKAIKTSGLDDIVDDVVYRFAKSIKGDKSKIKAIISAMYRSTYWRTK